MKISRKLLATGGLVAIASSATGCRDLARFDSAGDHYEGSVVAAEFVRTGIASDLRMCLTLDTNRLDDGPGTLTTSDGLYAAAALKPIPQIQHDALSTLNFGEGRTKSLLFSAEPQIDGGAGGARAAPLAVIVIVSLMDSGGVEVRFLAPMSIATPAPAVFGVFPLEKKSGACPFGPR